MVELARRKGYASERNLRFCEKIVHNSGLGPATAITTGERPVSSFTLTPLDDSEVAGVH